MINIMIVDDETPSRRQVLSELLKLGYDRKNICEAQNSAAALRLMQSFKPDILISDISMPKMLGTDLAQKVTQLYPKCKIIFFTGYSDKEYMKAAIKLNVVDYLEKPLDSAEFAQAVKKAEEEAKALSEQDMFADKDGARLLEYLFKNKPVPDDLKNLAQYKAIVNSRVIAAIMAPQGECDLATAAGSLINSAKQTSVNVINRYKNNGVIEALFYSNTINLKQDTEKIFRSVFSNLGENEYIKCAAGSVEKSGKDTYISYENAVCALDNAFFYQPNRAVFYTEQTEKSDIDSEKITAEVYNLLTEEKYSEAKELARSLYKRLYKSNIMMSSAAKKLYYNISEMIYKFFKSCFFAYNSEYSLYDNAFNILEAKSLDDLHSHIMSALSRIEQLSVTSDFNSLVKSALLYMERNFQNPNLSIVDIATGCNVNANYLCGTFKSVTGETINHYVNNLRISKAKSLILDTNKSIAEISSLCGFNDAKYFCKVFAKYTNYTPTNFKKKFK